MKTNEPASPKGDLIGFNSWLSSLGITSVTGWRWRKKKWIVTVNIAGRQYVSREAIVDFERRAKAGEFAQGGSGVAQPSVGGATHD